MKCPACGNQVYERLDYAIVRCTECMSLWDPYIFPGFPEPNVDIGEIWDTTDPFEFNGLNDEAKEEDTGELDEEDDLDDWDLDDEDDEFDNEFDDWYDEDEDD